MGDKAMQTSSWLVALTIAATTACIIVKQPAELAPTTDAGTEVDAGVEKDATLTEGGTSSGDSGACGAQGAYGFCENFDDKALPGAFDKADVDFGTLGLGIVDGGTKVLGSSLAANTAASVARLYKFLPSAQEVEIEFDFLPAVLHSDLSAAWSFVTQVQLEQAGVSGNGSVIAGVQIEASAGSGKLFAMRYDGQGNVFLRVGDAVPVVLRQWMRLRFRFTRAGDLSLYDVTKGVPLVPDTRVPLPPSLKSGMAVTIGAESYVSHKEFFFAYDNVVVNAR